MFKNKKTRKIYSLLILAYFVTAIFFPKKTFAFDIPIPPVGTATVDIPSAVQETTKEIEDRYGFDKDIWRRAQRKASAPRVEIFFDNTNPRPGEKVTAHAVPEFFKNDPQNLYYTWYIVHKRECNDKKNGYCDSNGDRIDDESNVIDKGKIEASKIMARGDYDYRLDGDPEENADDVADRVYKDPGEDPDKDGWPAVDKNSYDRCDDGKEDDSSCAFAPMGGADGVGGLTKGNDNIEPWKDGAEYCDTQGKHSGANDCNLNTEKSSFNQYYNLKSDQSGDFCTACQEHFALGGTTAYTYGTLSPTGTPAANVNSPNNQCCYRIFNPDDDDLSEYEEDTSYCPNYYNSDYEGCYDYPGLQTYNSGLIKNCLTAEFNECVDDWDTRHANPSGNEETGEVSRCYKHNFGVNTGALGFRGYEGESNDYDDDSSGYDTATNCVHKWEDATGYTSGSGKFSTGEEEKWKTDPTDPDTDGDGTLDEGDIIGLNQQDFTWTYQQGDRVGVVVEGTSMIPVDEISAYYKIMWGYTDVCDPTKAQLLEHDDCDDSEDYGYGFLATRSPSEEGEEKLKVSLSYSPDNPIADPSEENIKDDGTITDADEIIVTSSLDNTTYSPSNLYYMWQISEGDNPSTDDWNKINNIDEYFDTSSSQSGLGMSSLSFTPKQKALSGDGDISYFKVTLTVSTAANDKASRGRSSVVIGISKKGIKIKLYKVDITDDGKAVFGDEVCDEGLYRTLCPAVKYQMFAAEAVGSKFPSSDSVFSWSLNGQPISLPANSETQFDGWGSKKVFFPITGEEQELEDISVTATSKNELQPATGSRALTVVRPAVFIKPSDPNVSWPVTYTIEDPNRKYAYQTIESKTAFGVLSGEEARYDLTFVPDYIFDNDPSNTLIDWSVNGAKMSEENVYEYAPDIGNISLENDGRIMKITTNEGSEGQSYTLGVDVKKYWGDDERKIIYATWGIIPETLNGETNISLTTASQVPGSSDEVWGTTGQAGPGQILAAVGTHLPHYAMYVLRLVLTLIVMFFLSIGFYALTQKVSLYDEI